ncbi:MAG: hemolysin III family protein [Lachnospiraceae bacterium]|nr:hemolysin III family protein [Lachnospiraceae bacterium]
MQITIREPGSSLTHLTGMILAIFGSIPLLVKSAVNDGAYGLFAMSVFMISMVLLYGASALYHGINRTGEALMPFKRVDHMMIFVLIAGSYTPPCMMVLDHKIRYPMLAAVWGCALVGMIFKLLWVTCPKWLSSVLYISMGWIALFAAVPLYHALPLPAFLWLVGGGVVYTIGGILYALKLRLFNLNHRDFGSHEIFHLFVLGGSICHYIYIFLYVA